MNGYGNLRKLIPDKFATVDEAIIAAYNIYYNEMKRMKDPRDSLMIENR